ncbi:MAG: hypothetical protein EXQ67_06035 [Thermoleophilia bacterium]|nr:hypothetical protein [Thermoleophilia bacterium]
MIVRPVWRITLGPWVVLLGVLMFALTFLAVQTGEELQANVDSTRLIKDHAEMGNALRPIALALLVAIFLLVAPAWSIARGGRGALATLGRSQMWNIISIVLVVLTGVLATYWVIKTGYSGADAVWHDVRIIKSGD